MVIYKTTNLVNGKIYIGLDTKSNSTYLGSGTVLLHAIKKYGRKNFKKEILETCETMEKLKEREIFWISFYDATNEQIGYNISLGGDGSLGRVCKEETKEKLRKANIGKKHKPESIEKMKGQIWTEERRDLARKISTGRKHTKESLEKMSRVQTGKIVSAETRKKQSEAKLGKPNGRALQKSVIEERQALKEEKRKILMQELSTTIKNVEEKEFENRRCINKKYCDTDETREKKRKSHIGLRPTEASLEKMRKARLGTRASEETKAKLRAEQKKRADCKIIFNFYFFLIILKEVIYVFILRQM